MQTLDTTPGTIGTRGALASSHDVNGTAVYSPQREHLGHIDHVMIDKTSGTIGYAVLAFGGFLGLGENHVPMPWKTLRYDTDVGGYVTDLTPEQLRAAPEAPQDWPAMKAGASAAMTITGCPITGDAAPPAAPRFAGGDCASQGA